MKKTTLGYPSYVWVGAAIVCAAAWLPFDTSWMLIPIIIASFVLPAKRVAYFHPIGGARKNYPYFHWLHTVPYKSGGKLPNGEAQFNFSDVTLLLLTALSVHGCIRNSPLGYSPYLPLLAISASLFTFSVMTSIQLLNTGPRWLAYLVFALLQLGAAGFFYGSLFDNAHTLTVTAFALIFIATILAILGLHNMMKRFPWGRTHLPANAFINFEPLGNILYGNVDVTLAGEPFTSLRPRPEYKKVSWQEVIGITGNVTLLAALFPAWGFFTLAILGGVALYFRTKAYWTSRNAPFALPALLVRILHPGLPQGKQISSGILTLFILYLLGCTILYRLSIEENRFWCILSVGAFYLLAFKMPPSRARWETTGLWRITNSPNLSLGKGHQTLKLSLAPTEQSKHP